MTQWRLPAVMVAGALFAGGAALAQTQQQDPAAQDAQPMIQSDQEAAGQTGMQTDPQTGVQTGAQAGMESGMQAGAAGLDEEAIRELQQALADAGYEVGPVDGLWGEQTASAVREFQQEQGLAATGELDQETLAALQLDHLDTGGMGEAGAMPGTDAATGTDAGTGVEQPAQTQSQ